MSLLVSVPTLPVNYVFYPFTLGKLRSHLIEQRIRQIQCLSILRIHLTERRIRLPFFLHKHRSH